MLEEVVDAFFLEQPRDEVEMGLAILDAKVALRIALVAAKLHVCNAGTLQHLLHDLERSQMLKDSAIARECEKPQRRNHLQPIRRESLHVPELHELPNEPVVHSFAAR